MMQVRVVSSNIDVLKKYKGTLRKELAKAVRATAFKIEREAKLRAPVDTGALRASIFTVTSETSGETKAMTDAYAKYASKHTGKPRQLSIPPKPQDDLKAIVAVGMEYGIYVEYGTSRMAGRPYMSPASEEGRKFFRKAVKEALGISAKQAGFKT